MLIAGKGLMKKLFQTNFLIGNETNPPHSTITTLEAIKLSCRKEREYSVVIHLTANNVH